jgi:hypothetical protein
MYERNTSERDSTIHQGTRVAVPYRHASSRSQVPPTKAAQPQEAPDTRHLPHFTGYHRILYTVFLCRCRHPARHGDAWSPRRGGECYDGIPRRDTTSTRITWEEKTHRIFDILGKDFAGKEELEMAERQVYHADTLRALDQQDRNSNWAEARGLAKRFIPHDAIWHGQSNPKGCRIGCAPEDPNAVFVGANGGYRPGPTASAQGTRLQGRSTTLGHTWGASQVNRTGSSSTQQQGRSTTMGRSWEESQVDRGTSYTHGRM